MTAVTSQFEMTGLKLRSRVAPLNQDSSDPTTGCDMFEANCTFPANHCPLMKGCTETLDGDECYWCKNLVGTCSYMSATDQCSNTSAGLSTLEIQLRFSRRRWSHVFRTFVPSVVIVGCSWMSFWLHPRDITARVQLCVTAILALITMAGNRKEHGITVVRAEDVWMCGGVILVILALFESVAVNSILRGSVFNLSFRRTRRGRVGPIPGPSTAWAEEEETSSPETVANRIDFFSRILFPISFTVFVAGFLLYYLA
ncbi:PREDICTED: glycine receptor subunit alpha-1-like [Branchiostoma belcheri]|uniref:Glycine receptor subunit alpha-1-like n=1 Tax=Branchiostoma belcheri TaxID=7741 RepID=A0A6P4ZWQ8_BRABE|nr:PREDICTED: glycine receptor subunit alpha-1-like [Branchiostoma belcheri]